MCDRKLQCSYPDACYPTAPTTTTLSPTTTQTTTTGNTTTFETNHSDMNSTNSSAMNTTTTTTTTPAAMPEGVMLGISLQKLIFDSPEKLLLLGSMKMWAGPEHSLQLSGKRLLLQG